jgi:hypothetical protein
VPLFSLCTPRPTVCLDVTSLVVYRDGSDHGKIGPTRCALIGGTLGDRCRTHRASRTPPAAARAARSARAAGSRPVSPANPGGFPRSRTTLRSGTMSCDDANPPKWVGSGRVTLRHVSPIPPLDPCVRLSSHTAHERGDFTGDFPFHQLRGLHRGQLTHSLATFVPFSPPSSSGPLPCTRLSRVPTPRPYLTACWALEFRLGFSIPTLHPPCHPLVK